MGFLFEKLDVYQRGLGFVDEVIVLCDNLPKGNFFLADQLRRAALSIPLNIAEGNGRWHKKDRNQFFIIARGSCFECVPLLRLCNAKGLTDTKKTDELLSKLEVIGKMLSAYIRNTSDNSD